MQEQRRFVRVQTNLEVRWEELPGDTSARATQIGGGGCFVESVNQPADAQMILAIQTPTHNWVQFTAEIVYRLTDGFGLRFTNLSQSEKSLLSMMIDYTQDVGSEADTPRA